MSRAPLVLKALGLVAAAVLVALIPRFVSEFRTIQFTYVGIYLIALIGLNVLTGYSGQISLGHGAFMAIGAYTTGILLVHHGLNELYSIPLGGLAGFAAGYLFGFPALRLAGVYLALATFAVGLSIPSLAKRFAGLTGGGSGLILNLEPVGRAYYVTWGVGAGLLALAWLLLRGRFGRSLRAIRDSEIAAVSSGVNRSSTKTLAFGISAGYAGVAGSLLAIQVAYVSPDTFPISLSILLLTGVVVGGLGSLVGVAFGALFIEFVPTFFAQSISKQAPSVIYGLILIAVVFLLPGGAAGGIGTIARFLTNRLYRRSYPAGYVNQSPLAKEEV